MIISNFTARELEHLRTQCNFVGYETEVFELRSKGIPLEEIAEIIRHGLREVLKQQLSL